MISSDRSILITQWLNDWQEMTNGIFLNDWQEMTNGIFLSTLALSLLLRDGSGNDLLKFDGNPKNESFVISPATITDPHDLQPQSIDVGLHEESEDKSGVDEGLLELRCWIQMMTWIRITKFPLRYQRE